MALQNVKPQRSQRGCRTSPRARSSPKDPMRKWCRNKAAVLKAPIECHTGIGGGSASVSLTVPGQASRVEATFNPQAGPTGYPGPAPIGPMLQSSGPPTATGPTPFSTSNTQWPQYPQYPVEPPAAQSQGYWTAGQGRAPFSGNTQQYGYSYPTAGRGGFWPGPRDIPQRTHTRHHPHGFNLHRGRTPSTHESLPTLQDKAF